MVSVITCTIRKNMLENLINNFLSQRIEEKELILIINKNDFYFVPSCENIRVYHMDEKKTLGECLNYGTSLAKYDVIAKFDDDDYYSPEYLVNSLHLLNEKEASVVGKAGIFVYFKDKRLLSLYRYGFASLFLKNKRTFLCGGTLVFKKKVLEKVSFKALNVGEDIEFQKDCLSNGFILYSGGLYDYVLIRYNEHHHSWEINNEVFQQACKKVAITDSFEEYVWKEKEEEH